MGRNLHGFTPGTDKEKYPAENEHCEWKAFDSLQKFGRASRKDIDVLFREKLLQTLSEEQKNNKIGNLLTSLRQEGKIKISNNKQWVLSEVLW